MSPLSGGEPISRRGGGDGVRALVVTNMYPTAATPGSGAFVAAQVESLREVGIDMEVLHLARRERGRRVYRDLPIQVRDAVTRTRPDLVHVAYGGVMAESVTRTICDKPVLITFHGTDLLAGRGRGPADAVGRRLNALASRRAARRAAGVVVVSQNLYEALPARIDRTRIWIVPMGVDLTRFRPRDRLAAQEALGWDPAAVHVLFPAARIRPEKRFELAEAAVEQLGRDGLSVELHALEDVPYDDVPNWLNAANVVVMTSTHEGSPVIVKEALACNIPIVSVDVGDVAARIAAVDGCFIARAAADDVAAKLRAALQRDSIDGRRHVADLSLETIATRMRDVYAAVVERGACGREAESSRTPRPDRNVPTYGLMYHDVIASGEGPTGRVGPGPDRYKVSWSRFVEQLDRIEEVVGTPPATLDGSAENGESPPSWSLTFDDGGESALRIGEELARRGWRGHFFVTTMLIGHAGFVDADAVIALDRLGHVVGSHSATHPPRMSTLSDSRLAKEWRESLEGLTDLLGKPVRIASIPGGDSGPRVVRAAERAGVTVLFTSEPHRQPRRIGECLVVGRYSIRRNTSAEEAAAAAAGVPSAWLRQSVGWNVRRPLKTLAGGNYERVRSALLARDPRG